MGMLEIVPLPARPADWDRRIQDFSTKTLFHESSWLDFLHTVHPRAVVDYFVIRRGGATVGYFCAQRVKKVLFRVYGSPLPEGGMYMGPLVNADVPQDELLKALLALCRTNRIASLEMSNDWLDPALLRRAGFHLRPSVTHVCPLAPDEASAWNAMRGTCRTRIRKAEKNGLRAEVTDDPGIVDHFFRFIGQVLALKGQPMRYGIERPRALMSSLLPADRLFAVRVSDGPRTIGVGFYPHDERAMYYWDGASDPSQLDRCPNELLHWAAMREAIRRGIPLFNIGGGPVPSRFTRKFGGEEIPYHNYRKNFVPFLETARRLHHLFVSRALASPQRATDLGAPIAVRERTSTLQK